MVEDGIAILKVGPALTFAAREALYALAMIENEICPEEASGFIDVLDKVMKDDPSSWAGHYTAEEPESTMLRKFSYSDRSRYYMHRPEVKDAIDKMMLNLRGSLALPVLSQFMPEQFEHVRCGMVRPEPEDLIIDKIRGRLLDYWKACGLC